MVHVNYSVFSGVMAGARNNDMELQTGNDLERGVL